MNKNFLLFAISLLAVFLFSCEEEFTPEIADEPAEIVVEGYIEASDNALPPYVILTRSLSFFDRLDAEALNNVYVHDAVITVSNGTEEITLSELCLDNLSPEQKEIAGAFFGFDPDSIGFNFCAYTDLTFSMAGEEGKTYALHIEVEGKQLSSTTTIPPHIPLDSIFFVEPPGEPNDTLRELRVKFQDIAGEINYFRYLTSQGEEPLTSPITSVTDDRLFDGLEVEFPLPKAEPRAAEFDIATFGLFRRGEVASLKWINLDEAHFNFWNTLEFNSVNQGPFSSYTRIESNIEGGLGIWGGMSATYYELMVP